MVTRQRATGSRSRGTRRTARPVPFCPATITDGADQGGIWFDGEKVYDLDGEFIKDLGTTYNDDTWKMYDDQGNVLVTDTQEKFEAAAPRGNQGITLDGVVIAASAPVDAILGACTIAVFDRTAVLVP